MVSTCVLSRQDVELARELRRLMRREGEGWQLASELRYHKSRWSDWRGKLLIGWMALSIAIILPEESRAEHTAQLTLLDAPATADLRQVKYLTTCSLALKKQLRTPTSLLQGVCRQDSLLFIFPLLNHFYQTFISLTVPNLDRKFT